MNKGARQYVNFLIVAMIVLTLSAFIQILACDRGGGDDSSGDSASATPTSTFTPSVTPTPTFTPTPTATQIAQDTYFPANTGNIWYYFVDGPEQDGTGSAEVLAATIFDGYLSTPFRLVDDSGSSPSGVVYTVSNTSYVDVLGAQIDSDQYAFNTPLNVLNFPLSLGNSWTSQSSATILGFDTDVKLQSSVTGFETITVQGTTYADCYKVQSTITVTVTIVIPIQAQIPVTVWLAPNVGPVKAIATIPDIPILPDLPVGDVIIEVTDINF